MRGHVGPSADQVGGPQPRVGDEDLGLGHPQAAVLLQGPDQDPGACDPWVAGADTGRRLDPRAGPRVAQPSSSSPWTSRRESCRRHGCAAIAATAETWSDNIHLCSIMAKPNRTVPAYHTAGTGRACPPPLLPYDGDFRHTWGVCRVGITGCDGRRENVARAGGRGSVRKRSAHGLTHGF